MPEPTEKQAAERTLLIDLFATGLPQPIVDTVMSHRQMEALDPEELAMVAEKIAEVEVRSETMSGIAAEVWDILDGSISELSDDEKILLNSLTSHCYELRHNTPDEDRDRVRAGLAEYFRGLIDKTELNPLFHRVVIDLLGK